MVIPAAVGVCENDLRLDQTFLSAFAGAGVDLRMNPLHGGTLGGKAARIVKRQVLAMRQAGIPVSALVVHHDVDRASREHRVQEIEGWFRRHRLGELALVLVPCTPDPCLERWLCQVEGLSGRVQGARPSAGGEPWKAAWRKGRGNLLDRVRVAARAARARLQHVPDFDQFFRAWQRAGLEVGSSR